MKHSKSHRLWFHCTEGCFHNSIDTADSAEGGKQISPSPKARAHCWLQAVQARLLRGTVTVPFAGTQAPHGRPYLAVSCSVNWQPSCCKPIVTPSLTAYTMAVSVSAQDISAWQCLWTKYWLIGGKKQTNLSQYDKWWPSWALDPDFGERFYKEKKEEKFANSSKISYENIIIKCKTGGDREKDERAEVLSNLHIRFETKHSGSWKILSVTSAFFKRCRF